MVRRNTHIGASFLLLVLALLALCPALPVFARNVILVDDMADLLSQGEEDSLKKTAEALSETADLDVLVVTTNDAGGRTSEKYGDYYYLDHAENDDGVLYLIDMDNREIHISTSGIMRYYLTDRRIDQCLDDGYEYITHGDYASCFEVMLQDTKTCVESGEGADYLEDRDTGEVTYVKDPEKKEVTPTDALLAVLAGLVAGGGAMGAAFGKYRMKFGGYSYNYRDHHTLNLYRKTDSFRTRRVTRRHIPRNTGRGGGFSGGGGSTTHSTGGHSFGGGSRKF